MPSTVKKLDSNMLKLIAIIAMTIDHVAWTLYPEFPCEFIPVVMHIIGCLTCPIMCYFIAEGYHYTRDVNRYTCRLFGFALISHFAYMFAFADAAGWQIFVPFANGELTGQTSVMWPLAWGLVALRIVNSDRIKQNWFKVICVLLICGITFGSDWGFFPVLFILAIGMNRGDFKKQMLWFSASLLLLVVATCFAMNPFRGIIKLSCLLTIPLFMLYNGKRGKNPTVNKVMKWLFYIYYPLHLFIIGIIRVMLH